jgi:hypothetical protein
MTNNYAIEVGKKFPINPYSEMSGKVTMSLISNDTFYILIKLPNLTANEINSFVEGECKVFLYVRHSVPFLIFRTSTFEAEVTIDITKYPKEFSEKWLESTNDNIGIILFESNGSIVKGIKSFQLNFYKKLREILREQIDLSTNDIANSIEEIRNKYTVKELVINSISYQKLYGLPEAVYDSSSIVLVGFN